MFEDTKASLETIQNVNIKLFEEMGSVELIWIHGIVSNHISEKQLNIYSPEAIEHTLAYLKPLLERGELKACGLETLHPNVDGKTSFREFIGSSDEILNQIRSLWLEARQKAEAEKNPAILAMFESFGVMFVTAEGMTGMKRTFLEE